MAPEEGHWAEVRSRFLVDPAKVQLAGIVAFDVEGLSAQQAVDRLADRGIIGSVSPYPRPHVRFSPALLNTEDEIERALQAVREVA